MQYSEIMDRMHNLLESTIQVIPEKVMDTTIASLRKKNKKAGKLFAQAQKVIPSGVEHMLSPTKPYPVFIHHGEGPYLIDADGNKLVDYICGGGPVLLGHNPPKLIKKMQQVLKTKGSYHGLCDEYEILAAQKIVKHLPAVDKVRFLQSGTEADMAAIRLARAYTGRKKIIKFTASYHGWSDQLVVDLWVPNSGRFMANGIPEEVTANTVVVQLNDADALAKAIEDNKDKGGVAGVLVEPLGPESGTIPIDPKFVKKVREITAANGIFLIFDEVVTAYRVGMKGAQGMYGVDPELTVLGKIMGGTFPSSGALAGKAEYMERLQSGILSGDGKSCFVAGTIAANLLSCAASYYTLCEIEKTNAVKKAAAACEMLVKELNTLFEARKSPFFAYNYGSVLHVEMTAALFLDIRKPNSLPRIMERKAFMNNAQLFLLDQGIMTLMGKGYTTAVHTKKEIDATVNAYAKMLDVLK